MTAGEYAAAIRKGDDPLAVLRIAIVDARAAGYRAGQEAMRKRATIEAELGAETRWAKLGIAAAIRALPLTEEVADGR